MARKNEDQACKAVGSSNRRRAAVDAKTVSAAADNSDAFPVPFPGARSIFPNLGPPSLLAQLSCHIFQPAGPPTRFVAAQLESQCGLHPETLGLA
jgi:hypothetical protein